MPVEFLGQYREHGTAFHAVFHEQDAHFDPQTLTYTVHFAPVITDNFRLMIERTPAKATPQSWWKPSLEQMEVFGTNAVESAVGASGGTATVEGASVPDAGLSPTAFVPKVEEMSGGVAISTPWYRLVLDRQQPRILSLSLDSLGKGELSVNLLRESGAYPVLDQPFERARRR